MTIEFHCPTCQKLLRTADDKAGRQAKCPDCGNAVTVPQPSASQDERYDFGIEAGADEYVMKPFDRETLHIKLQLVGVA